MKKITILLCSTFLTLLLIAQTGKGPGYFMSVSSATDQPDYMYAHDVISTLHDDVVMYRPTGIDTLKLFPLLQSLDTWMASVAVTITSKDAISVIGQTHMSIASQDKESENEILKSQALIKDHLMFGKYEVIGWEGKYDNRSASEAVAKPNKTDSIVERALMTISSDQGAGGNSFFQTLPLNSGLWSSYYAKGLPPNIRIGIENVSIWLLHGMILHSPAFEKNLVYQRIQEHLIALRSSIAFYKTVEALHQNKKEKAAIIIGSAHLKDFYFLALETPMQMNLYNTSKEDVMEFHY